MIQANRIHILSSDPTGAPIGPDRKIDLIPATPIITHGFILHQEGGGYIQFPGARESMGEFGAGRDTVIHTDILRVQARGGSRCQVSVLRFRLLQLGEGGGRGAERRSGSRVLRGALDHRLRDAGTHVPRDAVAPTKTSQQYDDDDDQAQAEQYLPCLLYTSPSPRD